MDLHFFTAPNPSHYPPNKLKKHGSDQDDVQVDATVETNTKPRPRVSRSHSTNTRRLINQLRRLPLGHKDPPNHRTPGDPNVVSWRI